VTDLPFIDARGMRPVSRRQPNKGPREQPWRDHIAACATAPVGPGRQAVPLEAHAFLDVHFYVDTPSFDLDNLVKPVLDTLFVPPPTETNAAHPNGVLFNVGDEAVFRLTLSKTVVVDPEQLGVVIDASWELPVTEAPA